jgi:hypothetical protein
MCVNLWHVLPWCICVRQTLWFDRLQCKICDVYCDTHITLILQFDIISVIVVVLSCIGYDWHECNLSCYGIQVSMPEWTSTQQHTTDGWCRDITLERYDKWRILMPGFCSEICDKPQVCLVHFACSKAQKLGIWILPLSLRQGNSSASERILSL